MSDDARWMGVALALSARTRGRTAPNPNVGCVIVKDGRVVARGWTQPGGRPHAEEIALAAAGDAARGATAYVTLEPCAHDRAGGSCSERLVAAGVTRVVYAASDPDPRTDGRGAARLREGGVAVKAGVRSDEARAAMAGFFARAALGRPAVTLKLATSLDGAIALADGSSRWITGEAARAHGHLERSRHEAIVVGRGTLAADAPRLDVRLPGLEARAPRRLVLSASGGVGFSTSVIGAEAGVQGHGSLHDRAEPPSMDPGLRRDDEGGWDDERGRDGAVGRDRAAIATSVTPAEAGVQGCGSLRDRAEPLSMDPGLRRDDVEKWDDGEAWKVLACPDAIADLVGVDHVLVEGGAAAAAAFLAADLVDRLLLYRAPILIGGGRPALGDIGLGDLAAAHWRWRLTDARSLGSDRLEVYARVR